MKTHKLFFLLVLGLLVMAMGAMADTGDITAVTITAPASSGWLQGSYLITGTYVGNSTEGGNITVYNDSSVELGDELCSNLSLTVHSQTWSCTVTSSNFADDCTGHTIYAVYYNGSEGGIANNTVNGTQTTVKFDNTVPSTPALSFTHSAIKRFKRNFFTCTSTDVCDSSPSWQVSLTDPKSNVKTNKTVASGDSAYFDGSDTEEQGTYTSYCSATDDAGNVAVSTATTFRVSGSANAVVTGVTEEAEMITARNNLGLFLITGALVIVLIIFVVAYWVSTESKKAKKKKR